MSAKIPDTTTLHALLQHAPGFIAFTDRDMQIIYVNRTAHGYRLEDTIGQNVLDFLAEEQRVKVSQAYERVRDTGEEQLVESFLDTPDAGRRWMATRVSPLRDQDGDIHGFVNIATDVTRQKEAQTELDATRKELLETSHRAAMAEVATGVLHNVGNVLNSVNVSAAAAIHQLEQSRIHLLAKAVDMLNEHAHDLAGFLTEDEKGKHFPRLLTRLAAELEAEHGRLHADLSRLNEQTDLMRSTVEAQQNLAKDEGLLERVSPRVIIERVLSMFQIDLDNRAIEVQVEATDDEVCIDRPSTMQILANLIRNAIESMDAAGPAVAPQPSSASDSTSAKHRVRASSRIEGDRVHFDIADTGAGIDAEVRCRIFDRGFTTKTNGHGFGLHASSISAEAMNGTLTVVSAPGERGACFRLSLPRQAVTATSGK